MNFFAGILKKVSVKALVGFALAAISILLFAWISEEMLENDTARFDDFVRLQVHSLTSAHWTSAMKLVSDIGSPLAVFGYSLIFVAVFWFRKVRSDAVSLAAVMTGAGVLDFVLKRSFHRARPVPYFGLAMPSSFSFPSGHAMGAFCFCGMLAHILASRTDSNVRRRLIWAAAILGVALVGYSRIYLGVHYPTDVIASYAAGTCWLTSVIAAEKEYRRRAMAHFFRGETDRVQPETRGKE